LPAAVVVASGKSADAFRTISEVAADLDVPQHVLRFWESRFTQIKPVKRAGGRRFYRPEDVDLLRGIQVLLYTDGFTIRGVQKLLKEKGLRHVAGVGRGQPEPAVVEKTVVVEKPAPAQAKKRPAYLRAVPQAMSLPFFDAAPPTPVAKVGLAAEERARLTALLGELQGLKKRLKAARS
jgi:DNA-binding transcriptional MerR regulator